MWLGIEGIGGYRFQHYCHQCAEKNEKVVTSRVNRAGSVKERICFGVIHNVAECAVKSYGDVGEGLT
jgi:hypothetical protein